MLPDEPSTPKKRKFSSPRYVGDITLSDLSSPRRSKKALNMAVTRVKQVKSKIKILQQRSRRLTRKITTLHDLVSHLRTQALVSEEAENSLLVLPK